MHGDGYFSEELAHKVSYGIADDMLQTGSWDGKRLSAKEMKDVAKLWSASRGVLISKMGQKEFDKWENERYAARQSSKKSEK